MKKLFFLVVIILTSSCLKQEDVKMNPDEGAVALIRINDFIKSFTKGTIDNNYYTTLDESDCVGIIPNNTSVPGSQTNPQLKLTYSDSFDSSPSPTFSFSTGTGWDFSTGGQYNYVAYYPFSSSAKYDCINVDYSAQTQKQNGDFSHLADNDYMFSEAVYPESHSTATFEMGHLGAIANFQLSIPEEYAECSFSRISLESSDRLFVLNYSYSISDIAKFGAPQIPDANYLGRVDMALNNIHCTEGILDLYMMMNPAEIKDHQIVLKLFSNTYPYTVLSGEFTGNENQERGHVYHYDVEVKPKEFIPELPEEPQSSDNLNILFFGHSFAMDCLDKLPAIINASGIKNIHMGQMHEGNCSLQTHYKHLINDEKYDYHDFAPKAGSYTNKSRTARSVLEETAWDIIIFQHCIGNEGAGDYESYQPALNNLIDEVKDICNNSHGKIPYIGWNMFWSYDLNWHFDPAESMYWKIVYATQQMKDETGIDIIIPTGTVIQSLRHTSLCTTDVHLFQRDQVHLTSGIGGYAVACTVFEYLIKPIYGISVIGNSYIPKTFTYADDIVTPEKQQLIWKSTIGAVKCPYGLTQVE